MLLWLKLSRLFGLVLGLLCLTLSPAYAIIDSTPLPANQAFKLDATWTPPQTLHLTWQIAPGYHLYRDHFHFSPLAPTTTTLTPLAWPASTRLAIAALGNPAVYSGQLSLPFKLQINTAQHVWTIDYQGCSDSGFCYPPFRQTLTIHTATIPAVTLTTPIPITENQTTTNATFWIPNLDQTHILWALLGFFALGLLLAFTPCVLPMLPILVSIILGQTQHPSSSQSRLAFRLSLTYVLAMALTYAAAGLVLAWLGANIQAWLQQAWVLLAFGGLMVVLALAQWDLFQIRLPASWQQRLMQANQSRRGGSYTQVAIMGVLATLIVSPCVTPPLIATLAYISQVGNFILGGSALFILALGMGTPLILVGTFQGALLPKAGPWLEGVKILLGLLLFIVAGLILERLLTTPWAMVYWGCMTLLLAVKLAKTPFLRQQWRRIRHLLALVVGAYGLLLLTGVAMGHPTLWGPLSHVRQTPQLRFTYVSSLGDLTQQRLQAKLLHQPVLLDFYAKWCLSCQLLDKTTFASPAVITALANYRVLRVDMTQQTPAIAAILQAYRVYAPPQMILFNAEGQIQTSSPLVGEVSAKQLIAAINQTPLSHCTQQALFPMMTC